MLRLPTAAQLASADFVADVPDTKLGVRLELEPTAAPALEFNPRELDQAIAQANAGMSKAAGLISFALPKLTGVTFPGAGSGKARLGDGRELARRLPRAPVRRRETGEGRGGCGLGASSVAAGVQGQVTGMTPGVGLGAR